MNYVTGMYAKNTTTPSDMSKLSTFCISVIKNRILSNPPLSKVLPQNLKNITINNDQIKKGIQLIYENV